MAESTITLSRINARSSLRNVGLICIGLAVCAFAVYAHVRIAQSGDDYAGSLAPMDRVFDVAFALGLVGASFCVGRGISRRLDLEFVSLAEEVSFSAMLGVGAIACGLLGLGLIGALKPLPVVGVVLVLLAISGREALRLRAVIGGGLRAATQTRTRLILSLLFLLLAMVLVLRTASPPHAYDEAIYHLAVPKLFVERGQIYPLFDNSGGDAPFLLHMIYAVCLMVKSDIAAKIFSLCLAGISSLALYAFCVRFVSRRVGVIALFGFFGAGMVVEVAVTARIDVSVSGILFLTLYAVMVHLETRKSQWLWTSAVFAGFGLSTKYTAAGWLAIVLVIFLFESLFRRRDSLSFVVKRTIAYLFIAGIIASPWYIKNLVWFHNPVYPFLTGETAEVNQGSARYFSDDDSRKLDRHLEDARNAMPEVVEEQDRELAYVVSQRSERHPFRFWQYFTAPDSFNVAEPYHDPNYLFLFSPFFLIFTRRSMMVWLGVSAVAFFLFMAAASWSGAPTAGRYMLPIYPGLTVLAAYTLSELVVRFRTRSQLVVALPAIAIAIAVGASVVVCASRIHAMNGINYLTGAISRRQFMYAMFYYPAIDFLNHNLEPGARVMMMGAQMCYDMKHDYVADTSQEATGWRRLLIRNETLEQVDQDLKRQGITHILHEPGHYLFAAMLARELNPGGGLDRFGNPVYQTQLTNWATFERYRRDFLNPIYADRVGYRIYALK